MQGLFRAQNGEIQGQSIILYESESMYSNRLQRQFREVESYDLSDQEYQSPVNATYSEQNYISQPMSSLDAVGDQEGDENRNSSFEDFNSLATLSLDVSQSNYTYALDQQEYDDSFRSERNEGYPNKITLKQSWNPHVFQHQEQIYLNCTQQNAIESQGVDQTFNQTCSFIEGDQRTLIYQVSQLESTLKQCMERNRELEEKLMKSEQLRIQESQKYKLKSIEYNNLSEKCLQHQTKISELVLINTQLFDRISKLEKEIDALSIVSTEQPASPSILSNLQNQFYHISRKPSIHNQNQYFSIKDFASNKENIKSYSGLNMKRTKSITNTTRTNGIKEETKEATPTLQMPQEIHSKRLTRNPEKYDIENSQISNSVISKTNINEIKHLVLSVISPKTSTNPLLTSLSFKSS